MFEDLSSAQYIAIDIETFDPDLKSVGSGARRNGYILGIAIATDTGVRQYYPVAHKNSDNLDKQKVFSYLREQLSRPQQYKLGANILYDLEYLAVQNVFVQGTIIDVLLAEPLIDENQRQYNLAALAQKYLGESKKIDWLTERCKELKLKGDPRQHIHLFSADDIRDYAIGDVDLPLRIYAKQQPILEQEGLLEVFSIECRLIPLLLQMKLTGCRIDTERAISLRDELLYRKNKLKELILNAGLDPTTSDVGRDKLAQYLHSNGIEVPRTAKTNKPSFTSPFLQGIDKDPVKWIVEYKQLDKFIGTFLESQILGTMINDRIHAQFNQLRSSEEGTVTGRFSSSKPNLQNIPAHNSELGPKCRALFLPNEGERFGSVDYSQIEYRILCHLALGEGSEDVRQAFNENPNLDIHQWCAETTGLSNPAFTPEQNKQGRSQAKTINFGIIYGQGVKKTASFLGLTEEEAKLFLYEFTQKMPFAKHTATIAMQRANQRGWVRTILGRRRRFNLWEPSAFGERVEGLLKEDALAKWGRNIKRAGTYKALNAVVQGSSADLLKLAMVTSFEAGLFKVLTPLTTVHDELNVSIPQTKEGEEAYKELVNIMQTCYNFRVPILAQAKVGNNWSEAK